VRVVWRESVREVRRTVTAEVLDAASGPVLLIVENRGGDLDDVVIVHGRSLLMVAAAVTAALHEIRAHQPTSSAS
jgi:hypothetical protein